MVFIIIRVVAGVNEKRGWFGTNSSDECTIFDLYNSFVVDKVDGKLPQTDLQTTRITVRIGKSKHDMSTNIDPSIKLGEAIPCLGPYLEFISYI
jgi:hypothetical protein